MKGHLFHYALVEVDCNNQQQMQYSIFVHDFRLTVVKIIKNQLNKTVIQYKKVENAAFIVNVSFFLSLNHFMNS